MSAERALLLDITRLVSRLGRGPLTGIDRVEAAYLAEVSARGGRFLCRTPYGWLLLPTQAARALSGWIDRPETLPPPGLIDRLRGRTTPQARGEAGLRALALARAPHRGLGRMLARAFPAGGEYLNVGHATLTAQDLSAIARLLRVSVMIHDTIPLDHPEFCRAGEATRFAAKLNAALRHAGRILCNSEATQAAVARHAGATCPPLEVAPLGATPAQPDPATPLPPAPYFVALGTIEPRKGHDFLLDLWDHLNASRPAGTVPGLCLIGHRGWAAPDLLARLDHACPPGVRELGAQPDGAVAALLAGSAGLLMPSHAEGFGLPVAEAGALGVPVIAHPLPVYREILGDYPVYATTGDLYSWAREISVLAAGPVRRPRARVPDWTTHFLQVLGPRDLL